MADTISVPGGGKVPRWAAGAGLAAVAVLVIVYFRNKSAAAASPAAAAAVAGQYPADGTTGNPSDPYSTDPATGQTYGNEAAGSAGTLGAYGSGAASGQYYDPATGAYDLTSPYGTSPATQPYQTQGGPPFSSNSAWSDWVIQELQAQNPGINTGALTDALGVYLEGQPASAAQKTLIFDAEAIAGRPPVAGPGGYPPNVRAAASSGPGHAATVAVPRVIGMPIDKALATLKTAHLAGRVHGGAPRGTTLTINSQTPAAGRRVPENSTVDLSWAEQKKKR